MDIQNLIKQAQKSNQSVEEMKRLEKLFDDNLTAVLRKAPEEHKKAIEEVRQLSIKVRSLTKDGKEEEAKKLLNDFQNGSKDFK